MEEAGLQAINIPLEVKARRFINQRNMNVLATPSSMCKANIFKQFARTLEKVSLIDSY